MSVDHFPTTQRTWLVAQLGEGEVGLSVARAHVMARSRAALVAYVRGARVTEFLQGQGMKAVANVRGGIAAWSAEVDASVPAY